MSTPTKTCYYKNFLEFAKAIHPDMYIEATIGANFETGLFKSLTGECTIRPWVILRQKIADTENDYDVSHCFLDSERVEELYEPNRKNILQNASEATAFLVAIDRLNILNKIIGADSQVNVSLESHLINMPEIELNMPIGHINEIFGKIKEQLDTLYHFRGKYFLPKTGIGYGVWTTPELDEMRDQAGYVRNMIALPANTKKESTVIL